MNPRALVLSVAAVVAILLAMPALSMAQQPETERPATTASPAAASRVEVAVLGLAATASDLGSQSASGIGNSVPTGSPVTYFDTEARLAAGAGVEVRVSGRLWTRWFAEAGLAYARPRLEVRLDNDIEQAPAVTATTQLTQVVVDGALVRRLAGPRARIVPFVTGGGGYLRQLDESRHTVGTGHVYFGGAGALVALGRGGAGRALPRVRLRADVRVVGYHGGLPLADERDVGLVGAVGVSVRLR